MTAGGAATASARSVADHRDRPLLVGGRGSRLRVLFAATVASSIVCPGRRCWGRATPGRRAAPRVPRDRGTASPGRVTIVLHRRASLRIIGGTAAGGCPTSGASSNRGRRSTSTIRPDAPTRGGRRWPRGVSARTACGRGLVGFGHDQPCALDLLPNAASRTRSWRLGVFTNASTMRGAGGRAPCGRAERVRTRVGFVGWRRRPVRPVRGYLVSDRVTGHGIASHRDPASCTPPRLHADAGARDAAASMAGPSSRREASAVSEPAVDSPRGLWHATFGTGGSPGLERATSVQ